MKYHYDIINSHVYIKVDNIYKILKPRPNESDRSDFITEINNPLIESIIDEALEIKYVCLSYIPGVLMVICGVKSIYFHNECIAVCVNSSIVKRVMYTEYTSLRDLLRVDR